MILEIVKYPTDKNDSCTRQPVFLLTIVNLSRAVTMTNRDPSLIAPSAFAGDPRACYFFYHASTIPALSYRNLVAKENTVLCQLNRVSPRQLILQ